MKSAPLLVLIAMCAAACGGGSEEPAGSAGDGAAPASAGTPTAGWMVTDGIATPESVYFDPQSGFIFTSQINGQPDDADGNGRIVKLTADGRVVSTTWAVGLNAPKGLRSYQNTLWVADLAEVVGLDIDSGMVTSRVPIPDAQFLNDVATGADGTVYVSDMMGNRIYAIANGMVSTFAEGEQLDYPNGLLVDGNRLVVGSWGKPEADFSTKVPGRLYAIDLATKEQTPITPEPFANIDGVESDGKGGYLVTDYPAGRLLHVTPDGQSSLVQQFAAGSADIGFVPSAQIVLVPHMNENTIASYDISQALQ